MWHLVAVGEQPSATPLYDGIDEQAVLVDKPGFDQRVAQGDAAGHHDVYAGLHAMQYSMMTRLYGVLPTLARLDLARLVPALTANDVPGAPGKQASIFAGKPGSASSARNEISTYHRSFIQAQAMTSLGNKPLIVVSASETMTGTKGWPVSQQQLTALSSNADQRTVHSSHEGLLDFPGASTASVTAITDVVQAVRTNTPVRTS